MATETVRDEGVRRVYKDHNLHVLWGVTLMAVLGTSSITPAFPAVVREIGVSSGQVGLLITVFTLPGILLTPLLGASLLTFIVLFGPQVTYLPILMNARFDAPSYSR